MIDLHTKNWVNHLIIGGGLIFGILLIVGFVSSILSFQPVTPSSIQRSSKDSSGVYFNGTTSTDERCGHCLTKDQNNAHIILTYPTTVTFELPTTLYTEANLVVISHPEGILKKMITPEALIQEDWRESYEVSKKGTVEIIIKSNVAYESDYHVIITVQ